MRYPPGSPHNPMSSERLAAKFTEGAVPAVGRDGAQAVADLDAATSLDRPTIALVGRGTGGTPHTLRTGAFAALRNVIHS